MSFQRLHQKRQVRLQHRLDVDGIEALEEAGPEQGDEPRRDGKLRKPRDLVRAELAPSKAPFGDAAQDPQASDDHLAVIDFRQFGKAARFLQEEADDVATARAEDLRPQKQEKRPELVLGRDVGIRDLLLDGPDGAADAGTHQRLEQGLLRGHVKVEGAFGDPGARGHIVEARICEALLQKDVEGSVQDRLELGLTFALAPGGSPPFCLLPRRHDTLVTQLTDWTVIIAGAGSEVESDFTRVDFAEAIGGFARAAALDPKAARFGDRS